MASTTPIRSPHPPQTHDGSPDSTALPKIHTTPSNGDPLAAGARRSSFGFLRRKSSSENRGGHRSASGGKMSKKQRALAQEEALRKQRGRQCFPSSHHAFLPILRFPRLTISAAKRPARTQLQSCRTRPATTDITSAGHPSTTRWLPTLAATQLPRPSLAVPPHTWSTTRIRERRA
jgi:hypothetical protein